MPRASRPAPSRLTANSLIILPRDSGEGGPSCAAGWWKGRLTRRSVCIARESSRPAPPPPCFAWSPSPAFTGADACLPRSRDAPSHPSSVHATVRKPFQSFSLQKEGRRAPLGAPSGSAPAAEGLKPAARSASTIAFLPRTVQEPKRRRPRLTAPTAVMRRRCDPSTRPRAALPGIAGCKREDLPGASAASTWQTGIRPAGRCPRPPGTRRRTPAPGTAPAPSAGVTG